MRRESGGGVTCAGEAAHGSGLGEDDGESYWELLEANGSALKIGSCLGVLLLVAWEVMVMRCATILSFSRFLLRDKK